MVGRQARRLTKFSCRWSGRNVCLRERSPRAFGPPYSLSSPLSFSFLRAFSLLRVRSLYSFVGYFSPRSLFLSRARGKNKDRSSGSSQRLYSSLYTFFFPFFVFFSLFFILSSLFHRSLSLTRFLGVEPICLNRKNTVRS